MAATTDPSPPGGPLDGVRVVELGSFIAGPFAGQLLGDYGAEVLADLAGVDATTLATLAERGVV